MTACFLLQLQQPTVPMVKIQLIGQLYISPFYILLDIFLHGLALTLRLHAQFGKTDHNDMPDWADVVTEFLGAATIFSH